MLAYELGYASCIQTLLQYSSSKNKLDCRERMGGNTAFHFCCMEVLKSKSSNNDDDDGQVLHSSLSSDDNGVEYSVDDGI